MIATLPPLDPDLATVTLPLYQCPSRHILQELHEVWGNTCSPARTEDGTLPQGWTRVVIGGEVRYYTPEDVTGFLAELSATLDRHDTHTKGAAQP